MSTGSEERYLASCGTELATVKATYTLLFNMLALKFTSHGTESIQTTEIHLMCGRILPLMRPDAQPPSIQVSKSFKRNSGRESRRDSIRISIRESFRRNTSKRDSESTHGTGTPNDKEDVEVEEAF